MTQAAPYPREAGSDRRSPGAGIRQRSPAPAQNRLPRVAKAVQESYSREVSRTREAFHAASERARLRNQAEVESRLHRLLDRLERSNVDVLIVGAHAATVLLGPERVQWPTCHWLVLVPTSAVANANITLTAQGYPPVDSPAHGWLPTRPRREGASKFGLSLERFGYLRLVGGHKVAVQTTLPGVHISEAVTPDLWRSAVRRRVWGVPVLVPSVRHQIIFACLAPASGTEQERQLLLALLASERPLDWRALFKQARRWGVHQQLCDGLYAFGLAPEQLAVPSWVVGEVEATVGGRWMPCPTSPARTEPTVQSTLQEATMLGEGGLLRAFVQLQGLSRQAEGELRQASTLLRQRLAARQGRVIATAIDWLPANASVATAAAHLIKALRPKAAQSLRLPVQRWRHFVARLTRGTRPRATEVEASRL